MAKSKTNDKHHAEAVNFEFVPVEPVPCSAEEVEGHVRAFIEQFVVKDAQPRWLEYLVEKRRGLIGKTKAGGKYQKLRHSTEQLMGRFTFDAQHRYCSPLGGTQAFSQSLRRDFGDERGVYFGLSSEPCKMTVAEATTEAFEQHAIFSLMAGKKALIFDHEGGVWKCEKP